MRMSVTTQAVMSGIVQAIGTAYPDADVYTEAPASPQQPYFYVKLLSSTLDGGLNRRLRLTYAFDVQYVTDTNADRYDVADSLYAALGRIAVQGEGVRGAGMRAELTEDVLHFFVQYDFQIVESKPETAKMQHLTQEGNLKG
jgi:hypothetical protein